MMQAVYKYGGMCSITEEYALSVYTTQFKTGKDSMECMSQNRFSSVVLISQMIDKNTDLYYNV